MNRNRRVVIDDIELSGVYETESNKEKELPEVCKKCGANKICNLSTLSICEEADVKAKESNVPAVCKDCEGKLVCNHSFYEVCVQEEIADDIIDGISKKDGSDKDD